MVEYLLQQQTMLGCFALWCTSALLFGHKLLPLTTTDPLNATASKPICDKNSLHLFRNKILVQRSATANCNRYWNWRKHYVRLCLELRAPSGSFRQPFPYPKVPLRQLWGSNFSYWSDSTGGRLSSRKIPSFIKTWLWFPFQSVYIFLCIHHGTSFKIVHFFGKVF